MIDTITIILKRTDAQSYWDINKITDMLDPETIRKTTTSNNFYVNGKLKNMKICLNNDYLKVSGSLAKYYFGNNLQTLDAEDIILAIVWLGQDLDLPIERGYIKRIDVARNIIVRKKVNQYLNCFDDTDGYHKDRINDRLLYKKMNSTYSITLYDKVKELKKNDNELYQYNQNGYLKDKNILRYEVKLEQQINKLLRYKAVRVVHLRSRTFLKTLNNFWYEKYRSLLTKKSFMFSKEILNYGDFKKELFVKVIQDMGITSVYKMLEDLRKSGKISSNQKRYGKEDIKKIALGASCLIELDLTVELMDRMDFLYKNVDEDEFSQLKKIIVKKHFEPKQKYSLYREM